jgi:hypothetical protein
MCHPFRTNMAHMRYVCESCRFEIIPFLTASEWLSERDIYDETWGPDKISVA